MGAILDLVEKMRSPTGIIVTILIMVPTFVVSVFSMNVTMPFPHDHPLSFWGIMAVSAFSAIGFMYFWRRKKW
jgi:magnesium transporter